MGFWSKLIGDSASEDSWRNWKPCPFPENKTKADCKEWLCNTPNSPWAIVDPKIIDIYIDRMFGNPEFELFIWTSFELMLIKEYASLIRFGDNLQFAVCPKTAEMLHKGGLSHQDAAMKILQNASQNNISDKEEKGFRFHMSLASNAYESAILVEPNGLAAYTSLAALKALAKKPEAAAKYCKAGLARIEEMKTVPFPDEMKRGLQQMEKLFHEILNEL